MLNVFSFWLFFLIIIIIKNESDEIFSILLLHDNSINVNRILVFKMI
jgi:hypothetical protein